MLSPAAEQLVDVLVALLCAPGSAYADDDPAMHRPRLAYEYATGQWVAIASANTLLGWASWYRVDDGVLAALRRGEHDDWVRDKRYPVLTHGPHCYIATMVVRPGAPRSVYRTAFGLVGECNADAQSLSGHMVHRDGRERFVLRVNRGGERWWSARQDESYRVH